MTEETIFAAALEKPDPADRAAFLDDACRDNPDLRKRVDGLLAAHDKAGGFLNQPVAGPFDPNAGPTRTLRPPGAAAGDGPTRTHGDGTDDDTGDALAFLAPPGRPDSLGRIGHYEVLEVLGRGGFGVVFRTFDEVLQRVVAVKVLAPSLAATSPARKRFLREARSAAPIQHENVVRIHETGEEPLPYLVMEFVPGETLQERLDRTGPLEVGEALRVARQVAAGLAAAHETGLIHRDIKPSNILIDAGPQQQVKITDFGLARAADDASLTRSGVVAGTPMYMAPEQAKGESLDHRADLFSLGSVLYAMLTGRPPFRATTTFAVLKRVAEDDPRPIREVIPEVPEWLCRIVEKLHAKDPAERFQSAREVADLLADCEKQLATHKELTDFSRIPGGAPVPRRFARKWKWAAAAVALVPLLGGAWFGRAAVLYLTDRGELELVPHENLVSVIVLQNDEGVYNPDKLHPMVTDWLGMKASHRLKLPPGKYQLNAGTRPPGPKIVHWGVTTSGPLGSRTLMVPGEGHMGWSVIVTVERGCRTSVRPVVREDPQPPPSPAPADGTGMTAAPPPAVAPFDAAKAKDHQEAWAKHLGVPVETTGPLGMKLALIPPGEFWTGSSADEVKSLVAEIKRQGGHAVWSNQVAVEAPAQRVRLTRPRLMGTHEVTVAQFRKFVDATGYKTDAERANPGGEPPKDGPDWFHDPRRSWRNPGRWPPNDAHPVLCVSWNDAAAFCRWVTASTGRPCRLPTEAEWEFACRAGSDKRYSFGNDPFRQEEYAVFGREAPSRVGTKKANAFGLHDMEGNAWEWCGSRYAPGYGGVPLTDPQGPEGSTMKAIRGGGYISPAYVSRCASRWGYAADHHDPGIGFRVALDLTAPAAPPPAEIAPALRPKP